MPDAGTIAIGIFSAPCPVLFVDTCSFIDVGSGATRLRSHQDLGDALHILRAATDTPIRCHLVRGSLVDQEFKNNIDSGVDGLRKKIADLHSDVGRLNSDGALVGLPPSLDLPDATLPDLLKSEAENLLNAAKQIDHKQDYLNSACARAVNKLRPSKSGTFKDAQIMIECIDVARLLHGSGFAHPMVFLSSNTSDFGAERGSSAVHPDIKIEFDPVGLEYASNWPAARRMLGI